MSHAEREGWPIARPHTSGAPEGTQRVYLEKTDATMHSAGGAMMSADDAVRWLELMINGGAVDGRQVVPAAAVRSVLEPRAVVDGKFGPYTRESYGLGWYLGLYGDTPMVHHFGAFTGFRAHVSFLPEQKIGVAAFVNDDGVGFTLVDEVANYIYDRYLEREDLEIRAAASIERLVGQRDDIRQMFIEDRGRRAETEWTLTRPLDDYAGTYEDPAMGPLVIDVRNDKLFVELGNLHGASQPSAEEESIRVDLIPFTGQTLQFALDHDGSVSSVTTRGTRFVRR